MILFSFKTLHTDFGTFKSSRQGENFDLNASLITLCSVTIVYTVVSSVIGFSHYVIIE